MFNFSTCLRLNYMQANPDTRAYVYERVCVCHLQQQHEIMVNWSLAAF